MSCSKCGREVPVAKSGTNKGLCERCSQKMLREMQKEARETQQEVVDAVVSFFKKLFGGG